MKSSAIRLIRWLISALLTSVAGSLFAAEQLNIRHYDTRNGIPQIQVTALHQDRVGYLWVGTFGGLARYNGRDFRSFGTEHELNSAYVNVIASDDEGRMWVGTARGVCRLEGESFWCPETPEPAGIMANDILFHDSTLWIAGDEGLFRLSDERVVRHGAEAMDEDEHALGLGVDPSGRLWVGTSAGLLFEVDGSFRSVPHAPRGVRAIEPVNDMLWLGAESGLYQFDPEALTADVFDLPVETAAQINNLHLSPDGELWAASVLGLFRIDSGQVEHFTTADGLKNNITHQTMTDREGLTWVATDQGLGKILPGPFAGYTVSSGLMAPFVRSLNEDSDGRLWLGTREGVQIVSRNQGQWDLHNSVRIGLEQGLPDHRIYSIAFPGPSEAYLATGDGVVYWREGDGVVDVINTDRGLPGNEVHALLIDSRQRLWMSTTRGTAVLEGGDMKRPDDKRLAGAFALRIREDGEGRLWFTTLRSGLLLVEPSGKVTRLADDEGLTDEMLWDSAPASDGSMWVGSNGDGLFRVWPDGRIRQFTTDDGLPDNSVWQVLEDDRQRLWAYTNKGLARMSDNEVVVYGERDGLLHLEGGATGALQTSDGQLWFASADGLMRYVPGGEYRIEIPPPVVIEEVLFDENPVRPGESLPHRGGRLEFRYSGLSFQDESDVHFRYRLLGAEEDWSAPVTGRRVTFARLGYGDYVFELTARNPQGVESTEPARFAFSVRPPYWLSWWFLAAFVLATITLVWMFVHWRVRATEAARRNLQQEVNKRTAELRDLNRRLREASRTDQLTGLPNRRYLFDRIGEDIARVHRARHESAPSENRDLVFFMVDLDHFKQINDEYGHDAGDRALRDLSRVLGAEIRESDYIVRWGGEEFLIVAGESSAQHASAVAERMMRAVNAQSFSIDNRGASVQLTCSIGIASYPFSDLRPDQLDWEQVVQIADVAVYQAKSAGRNAWVRIEMGENTDIPDAAEFLDALRAAPDRLEREGRIRVFSGRG